MNRSMRVIDWISDWSLGVWFVPGFALVGLVCQAVLKLSFEKSFAIAGGVGFALVLWRASERIALGEDSEGRMGPGARFLYSAMRWVVFSEERVEEILGDISEDLAQRRLMRVRMGALFFSLLIYRLRTELALAPVILLAAILLWARFLGTASSAEVAGVSILAAVGLGFRVWSAISWALTTIFERTARLIHRSA